MDWTAFGAGALGGLCCLMSLSPIIPFVWFYAVVRSQMRAG